MQEYKCLNAILLKKKERKKKENLDKINSSKMTSRQLWKAGVWRTWWYQAVGPSSALAVKKVT